MCPSNHFGTPFLVIVELYKGSRDPPGPSWTPQGPFIVQTDQLFWIGLETTEQQKFKAWFEAIPTFGSGELRFLNPSGPFAPPPAI